jgi:hypothetical protein
MRSRSIDALTLVVVLASCAPKNFELTTAFPTAAECGLNCNPVVVVDQHGYTATWFTDFSTRLSFSANDVTRVWTVPVAHRADEIEEVTLIIELSPDAEARLESFSRKIRNAEFSLVSTGGEIIHLTTLSKGQRALVFTGLDPTHARSLRRRLGLRAE